MHFMGDEKCKNVIIVGLFFFAICNLMQYTSAQDIKEWSTTCGHGNLNRPEIVDYGRSVIWRGVGHFSLYSFYFIDYFFLQKCVKWVNLQFRWEKSNSSSKYWFKTAWDLMPIKYVFLCLYIVLCTIVCCCNIYVSFLCIHLHV